MIPMILLSFTVLSPWGYQTPVQSKAAPSAGYEHEISAEEAIPLLLTRLLRTRLAGEEESLVMVYGIDCTPGTGVDPFQILSRTEAFLEESQGLSLYRDEYRDQFEREMGYQAIERIPKARMLDYARDVGARYLLSGYIVPVEREAQEETAFGHGGIPGRLTFVLADTATGEEIWSESLVFFEHPGSDNQLSVRKTPR